jgi:hypothetical protein
VREGDLPSKLRADNAQENESWIVLVDSRAILAGRQRALAGGRSEASPLAVPLLLLMQQRP